MTYPPKNGWQKCRPSTINGMVNKQRRNALLSVVLGGASVLAVVAVVFVSLADRQSSVEDFRDVTIMPISCVAFLDMMPAYFDGVLDDGLTRRFDCHMRKCPMCKMKYSSFAEQRNAERTARVPDSRNFAMVANRNHWQSGWRSRWQ